MIIEDLHLVQAGFISRENREVCQHFFLCAFNQHLNYLLRNSIKALQRFPGISQFVFRFKVAFNHSKSVFLGLFQVEKVLS